MIYQTFITTEELNEVTLTLSSGRKKYGFINRFFDNGDLEFVSYSKKNLCCEVKNVHTLNIKEIVEIDPFMK